MVLCASNDDHTAVEPLAPPEGAPVGERVWFGEGGQGQPEPAAASQVQKKKLWEALAPRLHTDAACAAACDGRPMLTSGGAVTAASLANATIG